MIRWFFDIPSKLIHWRLNLVRTLGAYVPWLRRDDGSMKVHAGTLVDLFATILSGRRHLSARDADAALDILRYTFPEVEHRWLSNRFERSMRANLTVADVLASAASGRDETERMAIALEVLSLLINTGDPRMTGELFDQVTYGLELEAASDDAGRGGPGAGVQRRFFLRHWCGGIPAGTGQGHFLPPDPVFAPGVGGE